MGACRFLHWLPPDDGTGKYSFTKKHCSAHIRSSEITWTSPVCLQHLLSSTNMLPSSTNSPGASFHQTHGLLLPSVHFGPPSAMLKTFGNVLTLLLTGPPSSLSTSSSCLPKRVLLHPRIFSLRQPRLWQTVNKLLGPTPQILLTASHHFSWRFTCRQVCFFFFTGKIFKLRLSLTSHPDTSSPHSPSVAWTIVIRCFKACLTAISGKFSLSVGAKLQATNRVPRPVDRGTATRYGG